MKKTLLRIGTFLCAMLMLAETVGAVNLNGWHGLANAHLSPWVIENINGAETEEEVPEKEETYTHSPETLDEMHLAETLPMLYCALREYFGLSDGEPLTEEMLAQVTNIRFELSVFNGNLPENYNDMTAVKCIINNGILPGAEEREDKYGSLGYEIVPTIARAKYWEAEANSIADEWSRMKFMSFFTVKDIKDPRLEERAVAEILTMHPNTSQDAIVYIDPYAKGRELRELVNIALNNGIAATVTLLDGMTIDLDRLAYGLFPNLDVMEFTDGLNAKNVPDGLTVMVETEMPPADNLG